MNLKDRQKKEQNTTDTAEELKKLLEDTQTALQTVLDEKNMLEQENRIWKEKAEASGHTVNTLMEKVKGLERKNMQAKRKFQQMYNTQREATARSGRVIAAFAVGCEVFLKIDNSINRGIWPQRDGMLLAEKIEDLWEGFAAAYFWGRNYIGEWYTAGIVILFLLSMACACGFGIKKALKKIKEILNEQGEDDEDGSRKVKRVIVETTIICMGIVILAIR